MFLDLLAEAYRRTFAADKFFFTVESLLTWVFYSPILQSKQTIFLLFIEGFIQQYLYIQNIKVLQQIGKVEIIMSDKHLSDDDSGFQSCDSNSQIDIQQEIQNCIRELPTLQLKVHAIAINGYLLQKRELDKKKQQQILKLQYNIRNSYSNQISQIDQIISQNPQITKQDYEFIIQNKHLLNSSQIETVQKILKGQQKLQSQNKQLQHYWLKCMQNSEIIAEQIHEKDKQVLKNLYKIQAQKSQDGSSLSVSFLFKNNKWFQNEKITKSFKVNKQQEPQSSSGTKIQWKENMNYTIKVVKNKKKGKKDKKQQITKEPSFFHFFDQIDMAKNDCKELGSDVWEDLMEDLELQHELSVHIYQDLIPKSLQFYLNCKPSEDAVPMPVTQNKKNTEQEEQSDN